MRKGTIEVKTKSNGEVITGRSRVFTIYDTFEELTANESEGDILKAVNRINQVDASNQGRADLKAGRDSKKATRRASSSFIPDEPAETDSEPVEAE